MKKKFKRRSVRLPEFDYSRSGAYFITICSFNKEMIFGKIANGKNVLSSAGEIAKKYLLEIPNHFENVFVDEYIIMPNHIHFILTIVRFKILNPYETNTKRSYQNLLVQLSDPINPR